jgi:hypothetical protein
MFHTPDVFIDELRSLEHFDLIIFRYMQSFHQQEYFKTRASKESLKKGEHEIVQEIIADLNK